jgi:hypothetical protein
MGNIRDFRDAKAMAKTLRQAMAERNVELTHSDCLELIAKQLGLANWNTLAARIEASEPEARSLAIPEGWFLTNQTDERYYRAGLDSSEHGVALIESKFDRGSGVDLSGDHFAAFMQSIVADAYRGRRMGLSASLRTENADLGSIWMRVDKAPGSVLRFDNMMTRKSDGPLRGTTAWTECRVILDVPEEASSIHYGFLLQGYGRVWARSLRLERVGSEIAPTSGRYLERPTNLDFSRSPGSNV